MDTTSEHYKGKFSNIYAVHMAFPNGGAEGDYVDIGGFAHYWNADRGTWVVNENRDDYWDEKFAEIQAIKDEADENKENIATNTTNIATNAANIKTLQEKEVYLTQAEYDALVDAGTVDPTKDYNILDED